MTKRVIGALAALGVLSSGMAAYAATATATGDMTVSAQVVSVCSVSATTAAFGDLTVASSKFAAKTATSTLTVSCTVPTTFSVVADAGDYGVGEQRNLKLSGGSDLIPYSLFSGAEGSTATTLSTKWIDEATALASKSVPITAKIAADTTATALGDYTDAVTFTVTYAANND